MFWTANTQNARGQITQDTLGNGIVRSRAFDAITGWLASIQAGPSGNTTSLQNTSYLYDVVGNVTQRQNNRLGLTENFYYADSGDNLYRLGHSTLTSNGTTSENLRLSYDALGNIRTKNEAGVHDRPVAQAITWTSYNYPATITAPTTGETAAFSYGPDRQRWKMVFSADSIAETTYYVGGLMEKVSIGSYADYRHYIYAGGEPIAVYSRTSAGQNTVRYVLSDHQGSIDTLAVSPNTRVTDESFTAYGLRRDAATWSDGPTSGDRDLADGITRQGYTFQTVLGRMGLNHMNGRVQDAVIGRFISPDPFVTEPGNTQNFNRYAYVYNNPLSYVDPSGFSCTMSGEYRRGPDDDTSGDLSEQECQAYQQYVEEQMRLWLDGLKFPQREWPANTPRQEWADPNTSWNYSSGSVAGWVPGSTVSGSWANPASWMTGFNDFITSPEVVNFSAGLGDAILFNQGDRIRGWLDIGGGIDYTSDEYTAGTWTGVGVTTLTGGAGGLRLAGTASRGLEFSHWIPARWGGARSLWNGNYVTTIKHALSDPFRYRFMPRTWKALNPLPSTLTQQWNRIPYLWKGLVGGGAYGSVTLLDGEEEE